jgi:AcrR family transcriptional regulator
MNGNSSETRVRILLAAYALFYRKGFQRTSLDDIAAKAGVTKRTLYYHVRSKDELVGAMLEYQHAFVLDQVARWVDPQPNSPGVPRVRPKATTREAKKLIDNLFMGVERWAERGHAGKMRQIGPRWTGSGFTRMAVELADLPGHPARVATRHHKAAVEAALACRFAASKIRNARRVAAQVQVLLEGAILLILIHGEVGYAKLAAAAARKLI